MCLSSCSCLDVSDQLVLSSHVLLMSLFPSFIYDRDAQYFRVRLDPRHTWTIAVEQQSVIETVAPAYDALIPTSTPLRLC